MQAIPTKGATPSRRDILSLAAAPLALAAVPGATQSVQPVPPRPRRGKTIAEYSLDGIWKFRTDPYSEGADAGWSAPDLVDTGWEDMPVPGVWDVMNHHADYVGEAWYRTSFETDPAWVGRLVRLKFDGVYNHATVWLNGRQIGTNDMGYLPFHMDLVGLAPPGRRNQLTVRADNRFKLGAVWNWGGIRRPVSLEVTAPSRLERVAIAAIPDLANGRARVRVDASAVCHGPTEANLVARLTIRLAGVPIWEGAAPRASLQGRTLNFTFAADLSAEQVRLWHFNSPHLYEAEVALLRGDVEVHALSDRFGIRKVEIDGDRLLLNGEPVRAVGFNMVPEDRRTGSALPLSRIRADVDLMKMLGANMARLSHFPLPADLLDYLDEVGMLIVDEVPIWGQNALVDAQSKVAASWLERLIDAHRNHPSVIAWCVGNEIGFYDKNPGVKDYVRTAIARAKAQDPSRMAVYVTHSAARQPDDPVEFSDMIFMNAYGNMAEAIEKTRRLHPGKPIFLSEYGDGLDGEDPNETRNTGDGLLAQMRGKPYVMGASLWTFADYRSSWPGWPFSPPTPPSQNRSWGVLTVDRRPKRSYESYRIAHAPVRQMNLAPRGNGWIVTLAPRAPDDLPAYPLRGYRLFWRAADNDGRAVDAGVIDVPTLNMGASPVSLPVPVSGNIARISADLVDPAGYSVLTVTRNLQPPGRPAIKLVHSSGKALRAVFDRMPRATAHILICDGPDGEKRSNPTINDFAEIADLVQGKAYTLRLIAVNDAGESAPSPPTRVTTEAGDLPPIIWSTQSADKAIFVNYATITTDYLYDVEVTPEGGKPRVVSVSTVGTTRIPGLENGRACRLRMRRCNGLGFWSGWSAPFEAVARGPGDLPAPTNGIVVVAPGDTTLLAFDPVENAAAYEATVDGRTVRIERAASGIALLPGVTRARHVSLKAIDDAGMGGRSADLRLLGSRP
jgi:beta-galactosidase